MPTETLRESPNHPLHPLSTPAHEHLVAALDELGRAMTARSRVHQGDAMMLGVEHAARAFAQAFDPDTARILLARIGESLRNT